MSKYRDISEEHKQKEREQNRILIAALERHLKASKKDGRRSKLEIYYEILSLINSMNNESLPTHVQVAVRTSYDKFSKYLDELEENKLILRKPLVATDKGKNFLSDYKKLMQYLSTRKKI